MLGEPAESNYHFEDEYCQITCGADADGFVYEASHDILVCHDHQWVTQTFQPATLTCNAMPCLSYPTSPFEEAPANTQFECNATPITPTGANTADTFVNEGAECRVTSCDANYFNPLGFSKITCQDTMWQGDLKCQLSQTPCSGYPQEDPNGGITCSQDNKVPGENAYFDGTKCDLFCNTGWVPDPSNEQPQVQCNNGAWDNPYTCQKSKYSQSDFHG